MNKAVIYTLNSIGNLGCFPECVVVETGGDGKIGVDFIKISNMNSARFSYLFDERDKKLVKCCLKLDKNAIVKRIADPESKTWETLIAKYFSPQNNQVKIITTRDYIIDYVNSYLNTFFDNISGKRLFTPVGKFPFMWSQLSIEEEMPEVLYRFDNQLEQLLYSLEIVCRNEKLSITNSVLISRNRARILIQNKLYEFDVDVDGAKLIPFFNKDSVIVSKQNLQVYTEKVIMPMVLTNRVIPIGFEVQVINDISNVVLKVKDISSAAQFSLFEESNVDLHSFLLELVFEYDDFSFAAGRAGKTLRLEDEENSFCIRQVIRDEIAEKVYVESMRSIGFELETKTCKMTMTDGLDLLADRRSAIESAGVEIRFENKSKAKQSVFLGERNILIELEEQRDWFDIKATVKFGEFEIPFLQILNLIKKNKNQFILPNGELAQIPQVWFDEFRTLFEYSKIEDGKAVVAKHYAVIAEDLENHQKLSLKIKENFRNLLNLDFHHNYPLPQSFVGELRQYQQLGYNWLRLLDEINLGACLADEMGLGKTIQALCLLQWLKEQNRGINLLVVPTSLVFNWQQEIAKFCPDLKLYTHLGADRAKSCEDLGSPDILLTSYAILRRDKEIFSSMNFDYFILDEAQNIKNPQSDITKVCLSISAKHFLTLTGTPLENSLTDLWSQVHFFNRNMLGSLSQFNKAVKSSDRVDLYKKLINPFLLRRKKSDVLTDLPEKSVIVQYCEMGEEQYTYYKEIRNRFRDKFIDNRDDNNKLSSIVLLEGLMRLRQSANHPIMADNSYIGGSGKFDLVCEKIDDVICQGSKVLIFSSFVEHLKIYKQYLDSKNIKYCYLDGSTKNRQEQVENFQNNTEYQVFLLSLKAGGTGLNLTAASYVFLLDPWWNPAAESQAFDRAHRIGQQNKVFIYKFISRNSVEEKILKLQEEKLELFEQMINTSDSVISKLDIDAVLGLID
jgi:superfamily II DNA or RNA helicase